MLLQRIELNNYRNYSQLELKVNPGINVLTGDNAQGKTNFLEALYVLGCGKSFRVRRENELLRWGAKYLSIQACFTRDDGQQRELVLRSGADDEHAWSRKVTVNDVAVSRLAQLLGEVPMSLFVPGDLALVQGGPVIRRRYLDVLLCKVSAEYCDSLLQYQKIVKERNALLRRDNVGSWELEVWEKQLAQRAELLVSYRQAMITQLEEQVSSIFQHLSGEGTKISLAYRTNCGANWQDTLTLLAQKRPWEIARQGTLIGPHHDDLQVCIGGRSLKQYGSQGQHRSVALALRLAEASVIGSRLQQKAIVLLDDCFSELDKGRCRRLYDCLSSFGQVFITTSNAINVQNFSSPDRVGLPISAYQVCQGRITSLPSPEQAASQAGVQ